MTDIPGSETPWITPVTEYFKRDKQALGAMVLITVQCFDGTRKVVEGYHTGNAVSYTHLTLPTNREV